MKKNSDGLLIALGGAVVLYLLSRTNQGEAVIQEGSTEVGTILSGIRGIRNNNPGNIRRSGDAWQGLAATQNDESFFQFTTMEYGIRAIAVILQSYYVNHGLDTVTGIISRWAPSSENATGAYIAAVSRVANVDANEPLDMGDPDTLFAVIRGIIRQENGAVAAALISDDTVRNGIALAMG